MTATVWRIVGENSGNIYATFCAPEASEDVQAYLANTMFDQVVAFNTDLVPTIDKLTVQVLDSDGENWLT